MLTPRFTLSQDEDTLTITIRAPYCNLRELDICVEECNFIFLCKPYYLRLCLPGSIVENDFTTSSFDADNGEFTFRYQKDTKGEHFSDLEFITKFLAPKIELEGTENQNKIVVLTNGGNEEVQAEMELDLNNGFGFAMQGYKEFPSASYEFDDVFEIDPREVSLEERRKLRLQCEQGKFNSDHYLADYVEDDEIEEIINHKSPWSEETDVKFTSQELDFLKDLTNVQYNLSEIQVKYCNNCLLDILYAYCYDKRSTFFDGNTESGWTINTLSASLCWLDGFEDPKSALISAYRRALIHPLFRNFKLNQTVLSDLKMMLKLGEQFIIKCLIDMYNIFVNSESCRYILNNLFIKDYITYIMKWDQNVWQEVVKTVNELVINKEDLGLNLNEIETGGDLSRQFTQLEIESDSDDSDDDSDSTEDSDSTVDSDTCTSSYSSD